MNTKDVVTDRSAAISRTVERIRSIEQEGGVSRKTLDAMKAELMGLAAQEHLFPSTTFPAPSAGTPGSNRYLLREDPDHRFALYLVALNPGSKTLPHDHTTWAVVVAVEGQELNRVYRRTDDGRDPQRCQIALDHEVLVEPGRGIALMPDDIHSIHTTGALPTRHLHMYGLALEALDERHGFDPEAGRVSFYNRTHLPPLATPRA